MDIADDGAAEIATRSRGTPRIANGLLRWVRDYAQVRAGNRITREVADRVVFMEAGRLVEEAATEDFFLRPTEERTREFLRQIR